MQTFSRSRREGILVMQWAKTQLCWKKTRTRTTRHVTDAKFRVCWQNIQNISSIYSTIPLTTTTIHSLIFHPLPATTTPPITHVPIVLPVSRSSVRASLLDVQNLTCKKCCLRSFQNYRRCAMSTKIPNLCALSVKI